MKSLFKALSKTNIKQDFVLAVIIETSGSTYQKSGAMMLIESNLEYWGLLSGGCLEGDILLQSKTVFTSKKDRLINYNMRDEADLLWGMGLGCDGAISILLKFLPLAEKHHDFFTKLNQNHNGLECNMIINLSTDKEDNFPIEFDTSPSSKLATTEDRPGIRTIPLNPPHHLLICGGAPDVVPVTSLASEIGWKTTVIDHRRTYADLSKFPKANHVQQVKRTEIALFPLENFDSAVIMSHQFELDSRYLKHLLASEIRYLGLLGPAKRRDRLLSDCGTSFEEQKGRVFGPVGLDLGAGTPETIALSIICEIQAVINNKINNGKIGFCYQDLNR